MKFVTFQNRGSSAVGVLVDDGSRLVDLTAAGLAADMQDLIENYDQRTAQIEKLAEERASALQLSEVELLAPIPTPRRNIFCVGKNYHEHAAEFGRSGFDAGSIGGSEIPEYPIIFSKPPSSVIGPGATIEWANDPYQSVDYEAELAVIIGRSGRVTENDDPMDFVFGYTIINDVTSRELQKRHKQWLLGKGIDTFAPLGPAIVTREAMGDISSKGIRCHVNDEQRQNARIGDLIFDIPTLIRAIGRSITLVAGDIIATGTPVGVGIGFNPPKYLNPGDRVRVEIDGIGTLENPVG
ncbi:MULTISPECIES: fumarylacetoacetate hydrolase family protein [unclassified Rhizobium]|uniref:fumarylacetoacetate hydrolase family protein n=1 Tax=unclassified Rhizobium TaxID=2613769 RepID=UPI000EA8F053|nr:MULTISPECIES: fumarylacetoacetate hydrolase family protein [unclassified Rhizobium]AYG67487.1 FAA hydrolase family protein [Rhizobium sp. CCGE531]AYG73881.1 FAA hydrolase family protein [Rhizobium sp. CCGE532]